MFLCPVSMVLGQEKSITGCLVDLIEQIAKTLDNGEFAVTLFLDPSKIFDTINHSILLSKLSPLRNRRPGKFVPGSNLSFSKEGKSLCEQCFFRYSRYQIRSTARICSLPNSRLI